MNTRIFLENFWASEQKNELFVCMPFHNKLKTKFVVIDKIAKELGFDKAVKVDQKVESNSILFDILDGIANSKVLLFDLSEDPKFSEVRDVKFSKINENVLYELGVAITAREPNDILLIREKSSNSVLPFDITDTRINFYEGEINEEWLKAKLKLILDEQKWYLSRRIKTVIRSIDSSALKVIWKFVLEDCDHYNDEDLLVNEKLGLTRLIDLGIIFFAHGKAGTEYAYYWTELGKQVLIKLGIETVFERNKRLGKFMTGT